MPDETASTFTPSYCAERALGASFSDDFLTPQELGI
jgi:hypothetical protein